MTFVRIISVIHVVLKLIFPTAVYTLLMPTQPSTIVRTISSLRSPVASSKSAGAKLPLASIP
eukprot:933880-Amphidinium_carterae.2